jgi:hypothetical protein
MHVYHQSSWHLFHSPSLPFCLLLNSMLDPFGLRSGQAIGRCAFSSMPEFEGVAEFPSEKVSFSALVRCWMLDVERWTFACLLSTSSSPVAIRSRILRAIAGAVGSERLIQSRPHELVPGNCSPPTNAATAAASIMCPPMKLPMNV